MCPGRSAPPSIRRLRRPVQGVAAAALAAACLLAAAHAGERDDHERALAALRAGEVLPLPVLLERVQRSHPGQVLEVELEREDGRWIYELKLLEAGGRVRKLEVDARTAQVLGPRR
ncbi:PepSY domain-containing protein [Caldimonas sp. KR1-144]|uniref:PepSY domain-containing protein n=1 Tax=Caldimonas sp. KR1-144 TaxID=3400911 RepID=UPI003C08DF8C